LRNPHMIEARKGVKLVLLQYGWQNGAKFTKFMSIHI